MQNNRKKLGIRSKKQVVGGTVAAIILVAAVVVFLYAGGYFGSAFQPNLAPVDKQKGYYKVTLYDAFNDQYLNADNIIRINGSNLAIMEYLETNVTYYCDSGSYLFVNITGYHPTTVALWASGKTDPLTPTLNQISMLKKCAPDDVSLSLVRWYNQTGSYWNYTDHLPAYDGVFKLHFTINIALPSRNTSHFGPQDWIPLTLLPNDSLAYQNEWDFIANWLGFVCDNLTDYQFSYLVGSTQWPYDTTYSTPTMECVVLPSVWYSLDFYIEGHFTNLQAVYLFEGLIDNYQNPVASIT